MEFTAKQIAQFVQGVIEGDENASVTTFTKIEEGVPGAISFLANPKYTHYLYETKSSVVLVDKSIELDKPVETTLIRVDNARDCVAKLLQLYESMKPKKQGVDKMAFISESAKIGDNVYIGAFAYIGDNVVVGDGCQIYPNATICDNVYCIPTLQSITTVVWAMKLSFMPVAWWVLTALALPPMPRPTVMTKFPR